MIASGVPVVFGPPDRGLFGFFHAAPDRGEEMGDRGIGVVLCNPLGYEAMSAHRTIRHLAERLAARGVPSLRFDYDGTGNSAGRSDDPGRFEAWLASIRAAIANLRARAGVDAVALFGLRFGASLAWLAAGEDSGVTDLVLWAPVVSGKALVRELRAFRMLRASKGQPTPKAGVEVGGYVFDEETLRAMAAVDFSAASRRWNGRTLVLARGDRATPEESYLSDRLRTLGVDVELATATGYAAMMRDDPYDSVVPVPALERIVDWVARGRPASGRPVLAPGAPSAVATVAGPSGHRLGETAFRFGEGRRLFGVLTEPCEPARAEHPAVLLLNVGADPNVGPHRMNVEHARALASLGFPVLRFDLGGLGESAPADGAPENRLFALEAVEDVRAAMTELERIRHLSRFVLVGLCSGSFVAFHSALGDPRVVGLALFNPFAFDWKAGDPVQREFKATATYARRLVDYRVWARLFRGEVNVRGIAGILRDRVGARVDANLRSLAALVRGQSAPGTAVVRRFELLCDRGVSSLLVFSLDELDLLATHFGPGERRLRRRKEFSVEVLEGADHTFAELPSQKAAQEILARYVRSLAGPAGRGPSASPGHGLRKGTSPARLAAW